MNHRTRKGFTLIELLIVIAIIAILASVVLIAMNPAERFARARNAKRSTDVETIAASLVTYQADNNGNYPATVTSATAGSAYMVGTATTGCNSGCTATATQASCVDLSSLATAGYLGSVPSDPTSGTTAKSLYYIIKNSNGTITAGACTPELSSSISVTR